MAFKKLKQNIRRRRFLDWVRINFRYSLRKARRFFADGLLPALRTRAARRFLWAAAGVVVASLCIIAANLSATFLRDSEGMILQKLSYGQDYDKSVPYYRALDALGSSSHLCVSVTTAKRDNLSDPTVALEQGGVNLKLAFTDGTTTEIPLQKKFRFDSFTAGKQTHFIVALPYEYTPFDIAAFSLSITAGPDGKFDDWLLERAEVSFLLGGKRVLLAAKEQEGAVRLGNGKDLLRSLELGDRRADNTAYQQCALLFDKWLALAEKGLTDFGDASLKAETLSALGIANATALYLDVETVSPERNGALLNALGEQFPENEELNFNGALFVDVTFHTTLEDGTHTKRFTLDIPGKDDFELSGASTFRMDMPKGSSVFDIVEVTLSTSDLEDAWAPRFARLYLTLDYEKELELSRLTDTYLEKQYDSPIFYQGFLDKVSFDLRQNNSIPLIEYPDIEKVYGHKLSKAAYTMYFENQSYFSRQLNFYDYMLGLI